MVVKVEVIREKIRSSRDGLFRPIMHLHFCFLLGFFCVYMVPLTWLCRRANAGYKWGNNKFWLCNLLFMDDLKLFVKSKNQIDSPWYRQCIYSLKTLVCNLVKRKVEYLSWRERKVIRADGVRLSNKQDAKDINDAG